MCWHCAGWLVTDLQQEEEEEEKEEEGGEGVSPF